MGVVHTFLRTFATLNMFKFLSVFGSLHAPARVTSWMIVIALSALFALGLPSRLLADTASTAMQAALIPHRVTPMQLMIL